MQFHSLACWQPPTNTSAAAPVHLPSHRLETCEQQLQTRAAARNSVCREPCMQRTKACQRQEGPLDSTRRIQILARAKRSFDSCLQRRAVLDPTFLSRPPRLSSSLELRLARVSLPSSLGCAVLSCQSGPCLGVPVSLAWSRSASCFPCSGMRPNSPRSGCRTPSFCIAAICGLWPSRAWRPLR